MQEQQRRELSLSSLQLAATSAVGLPGAAQQVVSNGVQQVQQQWEMLRAVSLPSNLHSHPSGLGPAGGLPGDALVEGLQHMSLAGAQALPHAPACMLTCLLAAPFHAWYNTACACCPRWSKLVAATLRVLRTCGGLGRHGAWWASRGAGIHAALEPASWAAAQASPVAEHGR